MSDKLFRLKKIREDIGEEQFRIAAASIAAKYYSEQMMYKGKKIDRTKLLNRVI
jgi:hypothetical protein